MTLHSSTSFSDVLRPRPATLSVEAANPRHVHEWRIVEDVALPDGKRLISGVIDSTTNDIEHRLLVAGGIMRYATLVGSANVVAGTDRGFTTAADLARVDPAIVWAMLHALTLSAELASPELSPSTAQLTETCV
jgi:5-methyltetrahydropteroyltriglutamate--homocysteine methyltransferase